jgi:hypothetical protein
MDFSDLQFVAAFSEMTIKLLVLCFGALSITATVFLIVSVISED